MINWSLLPLYLLPFGNLLDIPSTTVSASSIVGSAYLLFFKTKSYLCSLLIILCITVASIFLNVDIYTSLPWSRIFLTSVYWSPYLTYLLTETAPLSSIENQSLKPLVKYLLATSFLLGLLSLASYISDPSRRPSTTFGEPSWYGLYVSAIAILLFFVPHNFQKHRTFLLPFFLFTLLITRSTQIFALIASLCVLYSYPYINHQLRNLSTLKPSVSKRLLISLSILMAIIINIQLFIPPYFLSRIMPVITSLRNFSLSVESVSSLDAGVVSSIAFLNGFAQSLSALIISPIIGLGAGMTGYFDSNLSVHTINESALQLNNNDAYSLFFRGVVEFGLLYILISFFWLRSLLHSFSFATGMKRPLLALSLCLYLGAMLKHPMLPSSLVFCAFYLPIVL